MQLESTAIKYDAQTNVGERWTTAKRAEEGGSKSQPSESSGETMAEKDCGVYAFRCLSDGRFYVGSSKRIQSRRRDHISKAKNGCTNYFHRNFREIGESQFVFGVLEYCSEEGRFLREKFWVEKLNAVESGFNTKSDPSVGYDYKVSIATRKRMSDALRGRKMTPEQNAKNSAANKGRKISAEQKAKISAFHLGRKRSEETRRRLSAAATGRKMHPDTRIKLIAANTGKKMSAETRSKISMTLKLRKEAKKHRIQQLTLF